jgi:hypothetical protein
MAMRVLAPVAFYGLFARVLVGLRSLEWLAEYGATASGSPRGLASVAAPLPDRLYESNIPSMRYAARRLPRGRQRIAALFGMAAVVPLALWLFLFGELMAARVFDNEDPSDVSRGKWLAAAGALAALGALASVAGLAGRRRAPTAIGGLVVAACASGVLASWEWSGWRLGNNDSDLVAVLVAAVGVGALALRAALVGPGARDDS